MTVREDWIARCLVDSFRIRNQQETGGDSDLTDETFWQNLTFMMPDHVWHDRLEVQVLREHEAVRENSKHFNAMYDSSPQAWKSVFSAVKSSCVWKISYLFFIQTVWT